MRGEWIEIIRIAGRALPRVSLPMRGEWIEIAPAGAALAPAQSLPMRGEWIEMGRCAGAHSLDPRLSPCGESGLKFGPVHE